MQAWAWWCGKCICINSLNELLNRHLPKCVVTCLSITKTQAGTFSSLMSLSGERAGRHGACCSRQMSLLFPGRRREEEEEKINEMFRYLKLRQDRCADRSGTWPWVGMCWKGIAGVAGMAA